MFMEAIERNDSHWRLQRDRPKSSDQCGIMYNCVVRCIGPGARPCRHGTRIGARLMGTEASLPLPGGALQASRFLESGFCFWFPDLRRALPSLPSLRRLPINRIAVAARINDCAI